MNSCKNSNNASRVVHAECIFDNIIHWFSSPCSLVSPPPWSRLMLWLVMCLTMTRLKIIYVSHSSCPSSSARTARSVSRSIRSVITEASVRITRTRRIAVSATLPHYVFQVNENVMLNKSTKMSLVCQMFCEACILSDFLPFGCL